MVKMICQNDFSSGQYSVNKNIRFKTSMVGSRLCYYSDPYIVVEGTIAVKGDNDAKKKDKVSWTLRINK